MKRILALLALLVAVVAMQAAAVERETRRPEREHVERRESDLRERYVDAARLPAELRRSWLAQYEGKDPRTGEELGHTLRRHVPDRGTVESIREHIAAREALMREQKMRDPKMRLPEDLSMYTDLRTAEIATARTIREHRAEIDAWLRDPSAKRPLRLDYDGHEADVGIGYSRATDQGRLDMSQPWTSRRTRVLLEKNGRGGYYVKTSYPTRTQDAASD